MTEIKSLIPQVLPGLDLEKCKESYSHIELTEEERELALYEARKKKDSIIKENAYWEKVRKQSEPVVLLNPALQKYVLGKHKEPFVLDEWNKEIFKELTLYFNNDPTFEKEGRSLKKGIFIFGSVGCGKTSLLKMFSENPKQSYFVADCNFVAKKFSEEGYAGIEKYFQPAKSATNIFGHNSFGYCFDDLGTEREKKHFGNAANVMEEIILGWYNKMQNPERLHISTNLNAEMIEQVYGQRIRSRMREMFNFFEFKIGAPDRRK